MRNVPQERLDGEVVSEHGRAVDVSAAHPESVPIAQRTRAGASPTRSRGVLKRQHTIYPLDAAVYAAVAVVLAVGWHVRTEQYLVAEKGLGYALGITGGAMLLAMLLYPLRKLFASRRLGSIKLWFRLHMWMGVIAPVLVLLHANFATGSLNDNVALFSMLLVAVSGLFGRYLYARIHHGLYGRKKTLAELRHRTAEAARRHAASDIATTLNASIIQMEAKALRPVGFLTSARRLFELAVVTRWGSWKLKRLTRRELNGRDLPIEHRERLQQLAEVHIDKRLRNARSVARFRFYERLFSLWQMFHYPLFVIVVIAAVIHVVAVHLY